MQIAPLTPAKPNQSASSSMLRLFGVHLHIGGLLRLNKRSAKTHTCKPASTACVCKGQTISKPHAAETLKHQKPAQTPQWMIRALRGLANNQQRLAVGDFSWEVLVNSVVASELVYKSVDVGEKAVQRILESYAHTCFAPGVVNMYTLSWCEAGAAQRYMIAESDSTMYVAFMGTKTPRDFLTNARAWQEAFLEDALSAANGTLPAADRPSVHSGFRKRADSVPIRDIWDQAKAKGKRLVLTGHSLGGSVATVCTLRLLNDLPAAEHSMLRCVGFATPAVGNEALKMAVQSAGWDKIITNITLPEDIVPHLLSWSPPQAQEQTQNPTKPQQPSRKGLPIAQLSTLMTLLTTVLPRTAWAAQSTPEAFKAASVAASSRGMLPFGHWLGLAVSVLPVTYIAFRSMPLLSSLPLLLPNLPQLVWSGGLFACYSAISTAKSIIRLGPAHYHMIGTQLYLSCDGQLLPAKQGVEGSQSLTTLLSCASLSSSKHTNSQPCKCAALTGAVLPSGPCCVRSKGLQKQQTLLQRIQWQYAIHRMPPLRLRLQRAWELNNVLLQ